MESSFIFEENLKDNGAGKKIEDQFNLSIRLKEYDIAEMKYAYQFAKINDLMMTFASTFTTGHVADQEVENIKDRIGLVSTRVKSYEEIKELIKKLLAEC